MDRENEDEYAYLDLEWRESTDNRKIFPNDGPLPETPPGLDLTRIPPIGVIRGLLPPKSRVEFERLLNGCPADKVERFVMDWGAFAVGLHNADYQRALGLIQAGRPDLLESVQQNNRERDDYHG